MKILYFSSRSCVPCRTFGPVLERVVKFLSKKVTLEKYLIEESYQLCSKYHIRSVPSIVAVDQSGAIASLIGNRSESEILKFCEQALSYCDE